MADSTTNINFHYTYTGLDGLQRQQNAVNRSSGALVTTTNRMNGAMAGLALRFVGYNLVLNQVMGAQQKIIELVKNSISKFREFETRLAEVSTILQEDVDQMARFKIGIENLATAYGKSSSDISKGLYDILSAAFASEDAMNLLNTSIRASIAGLSDVRTAVQIFTTVLNAYGLSAEQATHVSDVLFQAVVRGKFQFAELEQALGYVVPIAAQAGIGIEELTAALSTATRHGLHLDMTARGLALAIQGIVNPSEQAKNAAQKYGVEMSGLALRVLGLKGWFDQLKDATDTFGKGVIGELIPNMRSVRVAMVLAGEEGALGFAEDLRYLENISGRTDIALGKIMETSQFLADQLEQELEERMRSIGDKWDEVALTLKAGAVDIADTWQYYIPILGKLLLEYDRNLNKVTAEREAEIRLAFPDTDVETEQITQYLNALTKMQEISTQIENADPTTVAGALDIDRLTKDMSVYLDIITDTEPAYNVWKGAIDTIQQKLGDLELTIYEIELSMDDLNKRLSDPTAYGTYNKTIEGTLNLEMAQLDATKSLADAQHDIKMGLVDSTYEWVTNNKEVENAVKIIREHETAQKEDRKQSELMQVALKSIQIEMMSLQLRGMMKRRGLSRGEERLMKRLQIKQAKIRLQNMRDQEEETEATVEAYQTAQDVIDEYIRRLEEESYQLHYTYNQQKIELQNLIDSEHEALETRKEWWEITNLDIITSAENMVTALIEVLNDPGLLAAWETAFPDIDLLDYKEAIEDRQEEAEEDRGSYDPGYIPPVEPYDPNIPIVPPSGDDDRAHPIWKYDRGIDYVPFDQMALLHQGERVVPANENTTTNSGGNTVNISVVASVAKDYDVDRLAYQLGKAMQNNLMDNRTGKSRYRGR